MKKFFFILWSVLFLLEAVAGTAYAGSVIGVFQWSSDGCTKKSEVIVASPTAAKEYDVFMKEIAQKVPPNSNLMYSYSVPNKYGERKYFLLNDKTFSEAIQNSVGAHVDVVPLHFNLPQEGSPAQCSSLIPEFIKVQLWNSAGTRVIEHGQIPLKNINEIKTLNDLKIAVLNAINQKPSSIDLMVHYRVLNGYGYIAFQPISSDNFLPLLQKGGYTILIKE
jgi:hypothetical protein